MFEERIHEIEKHLFTFDVKGALDILSVQIQTIQEYSPTWDEIKLAKFNQTLTQINEAIEWQDYLRMVDLMRYELLPLVVQQVN